MKLQRMHIYDSQLGNKLLEALISNSFHAIVEVAYEHLNRPIIITNSAYEVILQIPNKEIGDFLWDTLYDKTSESHEYFNILFSENLIQKGHDIKKPILVDWGIFKDNRRILTNITDGDHILAYMAVITDECTKQDLDDVELISKVLAIQLHRDDAEIYDINDIKTLFLTNLLDGLIDNNETFHSWKTKYQIKINDAHCVIAIQSRKGIEESLSYPYIKKIIETRFTDLYVSILNKRIYVLITNFINYNLTIKQLKDIISFLESYNLNIGFSNVFSDIFQAPIYKSQADFALENIKEDTNVNYLYYKDVTIEKMLQTITHYMDEASFIHPSIPLIEKYDIDNNSELLITLIHYIKSMKDISVTAELLSIHRNTLYYRINKIQEIANIDFSNNKTYVHLFLNFYLLENKVI